MIYLIYLLTLTIIIAISFTLYILFFMNNELLKFIENINKESSMYNITKFNIQNFQSSIEYVKKSDIGIYNKSLHNDIKIILDEQHKQCLIQNILSDISREMYKQNCLEIKEVSYMEDYSLPPYINRLSVRVKMLTQNYE